jgi:RNA polymerase sigma-70 factor, ECF subfamily
MEEKEAISLIQKGDLTGQEYLVRQYQVRAVYAAFLIVQDHFMAEEIIQSAFLKVIDKIHLYDATRPFSPWFFRIVTNDAVKAARFQNRLQSLEEEADEPGQSLAQWLIDPHPLPETLAESHETQADLHQAMQLLSPEQRSVVVMRYYLGMSEKEMAVKLDKPISTVKWWLRVSRSQLGRLMNPTEHQASKRRSE